MKKKSDEWGTCPHCGIYTSKGSLKRWHFENCRFKDLSEEEMKPVVEAVVRRKKNRGKYKSLTNCPHCGMVSKRAGSMVRWHFDNCKLKGLSEEEKEAIRNPKSQPRPALYSCPHCNATSKSRGNLSRWHFDNCPHKSLGEEEKRTAYAELDAAEQAKANRRLEIVAEKEARAQRRQKRIERRDAKAAEQDKKRFDAAGYTTIRYKDHVAALRKQREHQ